MKAFSSFPHHVFNNMRNIVTSDVYLNTVIPRPEQTCEDETVGLAWPDAGVRGPVRPPYTSKLIGNRQGTTEGVRKMYRWLAQLEKALENELFR